MNSKILKSPNVYKPPKGNLKTGIFEDGRGSIHRLNIEGSKINILFTKKGVMRSGDLHKCSQFDVIFSGKIELVLRKNGKDIKKLYGPNDFIKIHPFTPHLFIFKEKTVMAEWWDGPFEAWYFKPYRELIEKLHKK